MQVLPNGQGPCRVERPYAAVFRASRLDLAQLIHCYRQTFAVPLAGRPPAFTDPASKLSDADRAGTFPVKGTIARWDSVARLRLTRFTVARLLPDGVDDFIGSPLRAGIYSILDGYLLEIAGNKRRNAARINSPQQLASSLGNSFVVHDADIGCMRCCGSRTRRSFSAGIEKQCGPLSEAIVGFHGGAVNPDRTARKRPSPPPAAGQAITG